MALTSSYARRTGIHLLDAFLARGQRIFQSTEAAALAQELGIPAATLPRVLHDLAASGWIRRARRGLYLIDETSRGGPAPHPFAVATALVEPSAISHWSALAHHGLTTQIPRVVTASTTKDVVTPRMRGGDATPAGAIPSSTWDVDGLTIRYIRVRPEQFWGIEEVWVDEFSRVPITDRERTLLDGFVFSEVFGSIHEVVGALEEHLAEVDVPRLVAYAVRYGKAATIKRVGYVLEQLGVELGLLTPLREAPVRGYRLLDPQGPDRGAYVSAWHIRDNLAA
ncbi:MAG: type IV toxin-antitoxin system AbiEi family antitoxin domain-containing protein [Chloroflexi bacterium]|nr:type IV toxin-antitoxin system AbiEi family antitoxin domain-containing protein [Chloroflexota bacterium]